MIVTGSSETRGDPSGSRSTSWWVEEPLVVACGEVGALVGAARLLPAQARGEHALGDVEQVGELQRGDQLGVEAAAGVPDPDPGRAFLQLLEPVDPRGHVGPGPVDPGGVLHRRLHLGPDGGDGVVSGRGAEEPLEAAYLVGRLGGDGGRGRTGARGVRRRRPAGTGTEHQALGQGVGAEAVGAVDAHARGLARRRTGRRAASRRRCRCGPRPSCSARPGGPGSARSRGRSARTSGTARARTAAWCRSASRRGGAGRGGRSAPTPSPAVRPFATSCTNACESRSRGPSSMLRSVGSGVGVPRS